MIHTRRAEPSSARPTTDRFQQVDILRPIGISLVNMSFIRLSGCVPHSHRPPRRSRFGESRPLSGANDNVDNFIDMNGTLGDVAVVPGRA